MFVEDVSFDEVQKPMILICPMDQYLNKKLTSAGYKRVFSLAKVKKSF